MNAFKYGLTLVVLVLAIALLIAWAVGSGVLFDRLVTPPPTSVPSTSTPAKSTADTPAGTKRVLFGDLHVHTSFSVDATLTDTPVSKGTPYTTPADACDFARYCSALDFWSINDHAEGLTPWQWDATHDAIRQCDAVTDPDHPDMVSFLGWEWTQGPEDGNPLRHYGHKNVIFRETATDRVPARPIASSNLFRTPSQFPAFIRGIAWLAMSNLDLDGYQNLVKHIADLSAMEDCADGNVRELPNDCYELAQTPKDLFRKLDEWGFDALVIPHGMAWGNTNPPGADFAFQMDQLNEKYQRLLEVYSGHGNSEVYKNLQVPLRDDKHCPAPANDYTPCCWQAGEIIRGRCLSNGRGAQECDEKANLTRGLYLENMGLHSQFSKAKDVVPQTHPDEWGQCDQLTNTFQAAFYYQPRNSAQYMLTLGDNSNRFRPGFIGSSDNHSARPGSSYKELRRMYFTDTKENLATPFRTETPVSTVDDPVQPGPLQFFPDSEDLSDSFYFTGGLVAVYSEARTRDAIWDALYRREVYGTSGPRIGLQFEMIDAQNTRHPMGSEVSTGSNPRFLVQGFGSMKQRPGCPEDTKRALGAERTESLCRNECYFPADEAHNVTRLEIIRILPRTATDEGTEKLIQDPWKVHHCEPNQSACSFEFTDDSFVDARRQATYYARVVQEATPTIQGDPLGCEFSESGECLSTNFCMGGGTEQDCLSPAEHRAWSSPIYITPAL